MATGAPVITRPNRVLDVTLVVAIIALGIAGFVVAGAPKAPAAAVRTTTVNRGVVLSSVQASGNVEAGSTYSVGFQTSGTVKDIDVQVGQTVTTGTVLAHLDGVTQAANLASAQAGLASVQAKLSQTEQGETPAQIAADSAQLTSAQHQLTDAQSALTAARNTATTDATQLQQAVSDAQSKLDTDTSNHASSTQLSQDQSALTQAKNAQTNGVEKDQQQITTAENQVSSATDSVNSTATQNRAKETPLPSDVTAAQAAVTQAQAQLLSAQQSMGYTTLASPTVGVVTAINGVVGQTVSGGGVSASQSSTTAGAGSAGSGTGSGSGSSSSGSSSSAFITITNVENLSVKAGFAETDAAKLKVGQPASVSFSALPNVQAAGNVTEVDVTSTLVSNVVTYYALVTMNNLPDGVKPGMTASVTVTTGKREGVLNVPSAAVRGSGSTGTVTVMHGKQQTTQVVTVGLRGDTTVEIISGVNAGDSLVLPSNTLSGVSSQLGSNINRFLGGGGLGGGGLGGGGARFGGGGGGGRGG